jgi:hypothetical protein
MRAFIGWRPSMHRIVSASVAGFGLGVSLFVFSSTRAADLPVTRLRVRIPDRGIYELTRADLAAAGVPVDLGFDPRKLRLFFDRWKPVPLLADSTPASWQRDYGMNEVAIWVPGEEDGRLDPADRVVFYALGPAGWDDLAGVADSLAHSQHPYDRFDYGWLVWGGAPGLRMETRSVSAPEALTDPLVTRIWHREHREEDRLFVSLGDLWAWQRIHPVNPTNVEFDLDLGADSIATGTIRLQLGSLDTPSNQIEVLLNDVVLGNATFVPADAAARSTFEMAPLRAHNALVLRRSGQDSGTGVVLELEAIWDRPLAADARHELAWSARPETAQQIYELERFGTAEPLLLDVTDAQRPVRLTDLTPDGNPVHWRVRHGRGMGRRVHYLAAATPRDVDPENDLEMREVVPLRSHASSPDMVIVTHPDLLSAAMRLATHRRTHFPGVSNPDVLVTTTRDIYDNFSGGRQDPLAIRNWVKFLYGLSAEPRLAYLLLLGDGSRDPRQVLPEGLPTLVPAVHPLYADARARRAYAVEDWFGEMQTPPVSNPFVPQADLSIGRLPARDLAEADRMVDKILAYESDSSFGPWRGRVLMAADDECNPNVGCSENYFIENAEGLADRIPAELDITKVYLTEYPLVGREKPAARAALIRAWNEGCALVSYTGRGNAVQLADEVLLLAGDASGLTNGTRLPLVLTFHDNAGQFDRTTTQTYLERLIEAPVGGAVAAIGTTSVAFVFPGALLAHRQFAELFRAGATSRQPLGLVHRLAKGTPTSANEHWVLLGDPALVLQVPRALVTFTSGADSLVTGRRAHVEGMVHLAGTTDPLTDFDGRAEIEVLANADESGYRRTEPPPLEIPYVLPGAPIYRGRTEVHAGRFAFEFTVPHVLQYDSAGVKTTMLGPGGRVSAYAWSAGLDAKGGRDGVILALGAVQDSSLAPPSIRLSLPSGATRVPSGAMLTAEIEDENGIWIAGRMPENSIRLQLDGGEPIDVTPAYRSTGGSDISGAVSTPLPTLPPGPHRATLYASDNLGHAASASLDFEVIDTPSLRLTAFRAAPNPTRVGADFAFLLDVPAKIEFRLFTVDGREVFRTYQHHDGLRRGLVRWNGRATDGRPVGSGVYLYKIGAHPAGSPVQEVTGKLAVLR